MKAGRYELHEVLGSGAFATVYRGIDPRLDAPVAIKVLADNWSLDTDVRGRFRAEAVLLRKVQADVPGMIDVFDIDETEDGRPFFVMTFADLGTLRERAAGRCWSAGDVLPVVDSLAATLGALHRAKVIHRDVKPSNLLLRSGQAVRDAHSQLVRSDEQLIVGDLGMAKDVTLDRSTLSFAGGTARYMAPEQQIVGESVDHRADIHAASVIVAELIAGPEALPPVGVALQGRLPDSLDPAVQAALERGVRTDPTERQSSMSEWRAELRSALVGEAGPSRGRRRWLVSSLVAGLAVAMVIAGFVFVTGGDDGLALVGPERIPVGETTIYRVSDGVAAEWTDWAGAQITAEEFEVLASLPGQLTFSASRDGESGRRTVVVVESQLGPTINGAEAIRLGQTGVFTATLPTSTVSSYWVGPDGARSETADFRFVPTSTGEVVVSLVAVDSNGVERGSRHLVQVES